MNNKIKYIKFSIHTIIKSEIKVGLDKTESTIPIK